MNDTLNITIKTDAQSLIDAQKELTLFQRTLSSVNVEIKNTQNQWGNFANYVTAASTAFKAVHLFITNYIIAPLASAVNSFVALGDEISKTSQRIGIGIEFLGGLKFAAEQCGANFQILTEGIKVFQNQLGAAQMGDAGALGKFGKTGLDANMLAGMSNEQQLMTVADHIQNIGDKAEQTRIAMELFGKAGFKLLPFFQEGSAGIKKLIEEGRDIGAVMGEDGVQGAVNLADAMNRLKTSAASVTNSLITMLAPALIKIFDALTVVIKNITKFINQWGSTIALIASAVPVVWSLHSAIIALKLGFKALALASAANPVGAIIVGSSLAAAAVVSLVNYFTDATSAEKELTVYTKEVNKAISDLNQTIESGKKKMDEMSAESDMLKEAISRLAELNEKESLNNKEKQEQADIIDKLNQKMPQLGIEIDKNTGKLKNFNAEMVKAMQAQADKQLKTIREEQITLETKKSDLQKQKDQIADEIRKYQFNGSRGSVGRASRDFEDDELTLDQKLQSAQDSGDKNLVQLVQNYIKAEKGIQDATARQNTLDRQYDTVDNQARFQRMEYHQGVYDRNREKFNAFREQEKLAAMSPLQKKQHELQKKYEEQKEALTNALQMTQKLIPDTVEEDEQKKLQKRAKTIKANLSALDVWKKQQDKKIVDEWNAAHPEEKHQALEDKNPEIAKAEMAYQTARDRQASAIRHNNGNELKEADKEVENAKKKLAEVIAEVSGAAKMDALKKIGEAEKNYKEAQSTGADKATLDKLAEAVTKARDSFDKENEKYFNAVGQIRKANESDLTDAVQTTLSSSGTFSAYGMDATASYGIQQKMLDTLLKILEKSDETVNELKEQGSYTK